MKKQTKKSNKGMSLFKRLTLGNMISAWVGILFGVILVTLSITRDYGGIDIPDQIIPPLTYVLLAAMAASAIMGIAQAVEGRYYGDVFGQMTRRNVTIMLTVFMSACMFGLVLCLISIVLVLPYQEIPKDLKIVSEMLENAGAILVALSWCGHAITSSIIVAKAK